MKQGAKCRKRDGQSSTPISDSTTARAKELGVKVFTMTATTVVEGKKFLNKLAKDTGGTSFHIGDYMGFISEYSRLINIDTDYDSDGLPDQYEENIPLFNGQSFVTNPYNCDTDGDGLNDGEEIVINKTYIPLTNNVRVYATIVSDPTKVDSDGDGVYDNTDARPLKNDIITMDLQHQYISVETESGLSYGGNQHWFTNNESDGYQIRKKDAH